MGCVSRFDFLRGILLQGLQWNEDPSANPYQVGVVGSTDSHNGTPGNTREKGFLGHVGSSDDTTDERLGEGNITHNGLTNNPGGLAAVWAVERSRDAIFESLRRREVYSTSGTRIRVRFFGGWDGFDERACGEQGLIERDLLERGYRRGVPMGGVLPERSTSNGPVFVIQASHDPGTPAAPGTLLQQAQIIKGWIDGSGRLQETIFMVAGDPDNGASVDPATCDKQGSGFQDLCAVWRDPQFAPEQRAFYYVRVLENPSCRWSSWECAALEPDQRPAGCSDPSVQQVIQERAVTSAIWYEP